MACRPLVWCPEGSVGALPELRFASPWTQDDCPFCGNSDVCSPVAHWVTALQHLENRVSRCELGWIQCVSWEISGGAAFPSLYDWRRAFTGRECHTPADISSLLFQNSVFLNRKAPPVRADTKIVTLAALIMGYSKRSMTSSFWASVIHRTERRQAVKGEEGTKWFLRALFRWYSMSNETQVQQSTLWLCTFRLSLKLKHYHWKILYNDGSSPGLSEVIKTSGCCQGRGKAFPPVS